MKEVARFFHVYEADLAASFLASHGVDAVVADRGLATVDPILQTALGGVRLLAPPGQAQHAAELLKLAARGEFAEGPPETPGAPAGGLFPLLTALSGMALGAGYASRPFLGARGRLSAVQITGLVLLGLVSLGAGLTLVLWLGG